LEQLVGRIAFPDGPLARSEHADAARAAFLERVLELLRHHVEGFVPGNLGELAVLVVFAVLLAQERMGEAIVAVHHLGKKIALYAVEAAIDLGLRVAMRGDHATVLRGHHDAATGSAEPAGRLVPLQFRDRSLGEKILRADRGRQAAGRRRHGGGLQPQEFAAVHPALAHRNLLVFVQSSAAPWNTSVALSTSGNCEIVLRSPPITPTSDPSM